MALLIRDSLTNEILYQQLLVQEIVFAIIIKTIADNVDHIVYTATIIYDHPE
ncbi:hypothetical protein [Spiroplasma endosymbiont of Polydrusus formosus]|uniref:hypothetical protein n=1 Tax=Spiroplasma endosymbiont of Polydrusus formosus TaxID=3139326 RepID=UPI0035B553AB